MTSNELLEVSLEDKYELSDGPIYVTGTQALARLPLLQLRRDHRDGLNTAGFVSGYRGSPLGSLDQALMQAKRHAKGQTLVVRPGVNEDLAATAVWGTQQVGIFEGAKYDGVFALWYGKGPGVDRSGDVFKHGNAAGSSAHGGVLVVAGDDHAAKSSTLPHQSDYAFVDAGMPVLAPAGAQEFADFGVLGWALSRYSGCWVAFKALTSAIESSVSIDAGDGLRREIVLPSGFELPAGGLNLRTTDDWWTPEARLYDHKLPAAQAFARANGVDRLIADAGSSARLGILTVGKGYLDVMGALQHLGLDIRAAERSGLRILKLGLAWPIDPVGLHAFVPGLQEILVVEEKRPLVEDQVKAALFNRSSGLRVLGKHDLDGKPLLPVLGELDPLRVAVAIGRRMQALGLANPGLESALARCEAQVRQSKSLEVETFKRPPHYCSGCPHNTSTVVPVGSKASAGIGCHIMARLMERSTEGFTQMGGEGAQWVGIAPFTETRHLFQNLGDGTYFHSGLLAIRQAVAAEVNITYKILFNDAVAMTGGQAVDGVLTVPDVLRQVLAENVRSACVVTDEVDKYAGVALPPGVKVHHRDELDAVQRQLREVPGVTVLVYDQTCAAEKRRRRKRKVMADPPRRAVINDLVCEGCGDCSVKSNCLSVVPFETEFGTKRAIDQSSCNKDFSCLKGFCPSFVTVEGGTLRKSRRPQEPGGWADLPEPVRRARAEDWNIVITGVGGTGVVTIGALLGMAAHLEGRRVTVLDMTGAAQKGGAVFTHVRLLGQEGDALGNPRVPDGEADLVLACDLVVTATQEVLGRGAPARTHAVVNTQETITSEFTRRSHVYQFPRNYLHERIEAAWGREQVRFVDAGRVATGLLGDSIGVNLFMLGYAWQQGLVPLGAAAIERAIELNGTAVEFNRTAFLWGRRYAHDRDAVLQALDATTDAPAQARLSETFEERVQRRVEFLTAYQDAGYARRYESLVRRLAAAESRQAPGSEGLADAVARNLFKLMAYKDEYEVARLHCDSGFLERLAGQFEGDWKIQVHLAPPLLARKDPLTGQPRKTAYGPWMLRAMRLLVPLRRLRGTPLDPFGWTQERKTERRLIAEYEALLDEIAENLNRRNHATAVALAQLPDAVRGYGHVKQAGIDRMHAERDRLLESFRSPRVQIAIAAAA